MEQTTQLVSKTKELKMLVTTFTLILILLKIIFYNQDFVILARTTWAIFWLFIMPGYFLISIWAKNTSFLERIIISVPISSCVLGITSYYIGLFGLDLKLQSIILPMAFILTGIFLTAIHSKKTTSTQNI